MRNRASSPNFCVIIIQSLKCHGAAYDGESSQKALEGRKRRRRGDFRELDSSANEQDCAEVDCLPNGLWRARLRYLSHRVHLGSNYSTMTHAQVAYDSAAKHLGLE